MRTRRVMVLAELDPTTLPDFRDRIMAYEQQGPWPLEPRRYPGYPSVSLGSPRPRLGPLLDRALEKRRSARALGVVQPSRHKLSRLLSGAHGITAEQGKGPVPSAGNLQSLELYLVMVEPGWLEPGVYHYDRPQHALSRLVEGAARTEWQAMMPSSRQFEGGALFWVLVGDSARGEPKYGDRAFRFLLLEAGHLMQNLCLMSRSVGLCTLPLGGFFEGALARSMKLPDTDVVLYVGACGEPLDR